MIRSAGIDLAGNPKNKTGFCVLEVNAGKWVFTKTLLSDCEIIAELEKAKPNIVAIDAPITFSGKNRLCDIELHEYGALPVTLRGMEVLAVRGSELAKELSNFKLIEIYATATAKILGFYDKNEKKVQKALLNSGIKGDIETRFLTKDELDAIFAAMTGYLHLEGMTEEKGGEDGKIVVPRV